MNDIDWKDVVKSALTEVMDDFHDNFVEYIDASIMPALEDAKNDFKTKLTQEAENSGSVWVKIRNALLTVIINIIFKALDKAVDKIKEVS